MKEIKNVILFSALAALTQGCSWDYMIGIIPGQKAKQNQEKPILEKPAPNTPPETAPEPEKPIEPPAPVEPPKPPSPEPEKPVEPPAPIEPPKPVDPPKPIEPPKPIPPVKRFVNKTVTHTVPSEVDVLVVGDNSGSMSPEQAKMSERFGNFLSQLTELDWRVAITTTDITANKRGMQGNLVPFAKDMYYLEKSNPHAVALFARTIRLGESGSGNERGICAMNLAIQRNQNRWMRNHAHLAVIVLTDENVCSKGYCDTKLPYSNLDKPETVEPNLRAYFGKDKTLSFHSIIIREGDKGCLNKQAAQRNHRGEPRAAAFGTDYAKLSQVTHGLVGSVCAENYATQLTNMAKQVRLHVGGIKLSCIPVQNESHVVKVYVDDKLVSSNEYKIVDDQLFFIDNLIRVNARIKVDHVCEQLTKE